MARARSEADAISDAPSGRETPGSAAVVPDRAGRSVASLVEPVATAERTLENQQAYQLLCEKLLGPEDYQVISGKRFTKKSGWRKLAVAFSVSDELLSRTVGRDAQGRVLWAEVVVRATAPNGRFMDGFGACDIRDRCCDPATCRLHENWPDSGKPTGHLHCKPDCDGRHAFSNPAHDVPSTAMTRATNRAFADLFGMGEVSAEEMHPRADPETGEINPQGVVDTTAQEAPKSPTAAYLAQIGPLAGQKGLSVQKAIEDALGRPLDPSQLTLAEARQVRDWLKAA